MLPLDDWTSPCPGVCFDDPGWRNLSTRAKRPHRESALDTLKQVFDLPVSGKPIAIAGGASGG